MKKELLSTNKNINFTDTVRNKYIVFIFELQMRLRSQGILSRDYQLYNATQLLWPSVPTVFNQLDIY